LREHSSDGEKSLYFFSENPLCVGLGGVGRSLEGVCTYDPVSFTNEGKESVDEERIDNPVCGLWSLSSVDFPSSSSPGGLRRISREWLVEASAIGPSTSLVSSPSSSSLLKSSTLFPDGSRCGFLRSPFFCGRGMEVTSRIVETEAGIPFFDNDGWVMAGFLRVALLGVVVKLAVLRDARLGGMTTGSVWVTEGAVLSLMGPLGRWSCGVSSTRRQFWDRGLGALGAGANMSSSSRGGRCLVGLGGLNRETALGTIIADHNQKSRIIGRVDDRVKEVTGSSLEVLNNEVMSWVSLLISIFRPQKSSNSQEEDQNQIVDNHKWKENERE
jgi:hypothetical protein